jgi:uncharacterized membrane protein YcjF (UPF0283 family)
VAKSFRNKKKNESLPDEIITVCPMCGTNVPDGVDECPKCGEPFTPEALNAAVEKEEKGSKWLFLTGLILVLIGGPGVALGSWLHDLLRITIAGYDNFESFGWANRLVSVVGIIILVVGIILLILSLPKLRKANPEDEEISESDVTGDQGG